MAVTGWKNPGTVVNDTTRAGNAWSNPENAVSSDNTYATALTYHPMYYDNTSYLKATNFDFSVPTGATINGIEVQAEAHRDDATGTTYMTWLQVRIVKGGNIGSTNRTSASNVILETTDQYASIPSSGGSTDLWGESWSYSDINSSTFGVALSTSTAGSGTLYVDHIQIRVYYTESSGTGANSERGLYMTGYSAGSSERGLYLQGSLTGNSTRGLYIEGFVDTLYSRENSASLKTDDSNLSTMFSEQDYTDVATDDDTFVDLEGIAQYFQLLFKEPNGNENDIDDFKITWKGKSSLAPSSSTVYLQIYNRTTESWTTLVSNSSANANTEFTLEDTVSTNLSDYYDANYIISVRVYQDELV